ncbi:hypothetical protein AHMF7616_05338 [Adhaeribacter pallidiroseus]|uniref:Uncharacterized protein n=1 Tax=Adhaeribacter pallidiroseus TaxID=2072847 RepID=A0A369Q1S6_9BACT|nr:hypothetical protein AHMF7616_05338 [Adhaeribacter pallidiroseus]
MYKIPQYMYKIPLTYVQNPKFMPTDMYKIPLKYVQNPNPCTESHI